MSLRLGNICLFVLFMVDFRFMLRMSFFWLYLLLFMFLVVNI
jgi:hypothetical protein